MNEAYNIINGKVDFVGEDWVQVTNELGYRTRYIGLSNIYVKKNQNIPVGFVIGEKGENYKYELYFANKFLGENR